ncbi:unnamed protein product [Protopolystoma xenopodis]|uniref:Uncharacterized protein n=1 Tax=Protopolystoma xenopodis TaxID=117903 RepID=A0A3S5CRX2_9PLAT|nr:unnamed protein product [Protopolystoma xenopodis]
MHPSSPSGLCEQSLSPRADHSIPSASASTSLSYQPFWQSFTPHPASMGINDEHQSTLSSFPQHENPENLLSAALISSAKSHAPYYFMQWTKIVFVLNSILLSQTQLHTLSQHAVSHPFHQPFRLGTSTLSGSPRPKGSYFASASIISHTSGQKVCVVFFFVALICLKARLEPPPTA